MAIEKELGLLPKGSRADVKTYLRTEHNADGTHISTLVGTLAGTQTITGNKTFTGNVQGIPMLPGSLNLRAQVVTTATFTITADYVYFIDPDSPYNGYFAKTNGTTYQNAITLDNTVSNGRDQLAAFTASSWVHFYLICKSSDGTIQTLSSATAPVTGPTRPTGFDMWAYVGAVYVDASIHLTAGRIRGDRFYYNTEQVALAGGASTSAASVDLTALVPSNALDVNLNVEIYNHSGARASSIENISGTLFVTFNTLNSTRTTINFSIPIITAHTIYYITENANAEVSINVAGFTVSNGAR